MDCGTCHPILRHETRGLTFLRLDLHEGRITSDGHGTTMGQGTFGILFMSNWLFLLLRRAYIWAGHFSVFSGFLGTTASICLDIRTERFSSLGLGFHVSCHFFSQLP